MTTYIKKIIVTKLTVRNDTRARSRFVKISYGKNALLQSSDKYTNPGRNLPDNELFLLDQWRQQLRDFPSTLTLDDLRLDDVDKSKLPKAPTIVCLNILCMAFPFISKSRPNIN